MRDTAGLITRDRRHPFDSHAVVGRSRLLAARAFEGVLDGGCKLLALPMHEGRATTRPRELKSPEPTVGCFLHPPEYDPCKRNTTCP